MNPLTNMKNVTKLSEQELQFPNKTSWHDQYKDSAWIFAGGLPYDLTEGDIICIFSEVGEIVHIRLVRDKDTGKSKGFAFLCYEDQRSTTLAVDNLNGIQVLNRKIRVDHVAKYKVPKDALDKVQHLKEQVPVEPEAKRVKIDLDAQVEGDVRLPARLQIHPAEEESQVKDKKMLKKAKKERKTKKEKKRKKDKKKKKKKTKKRKHSSSSSDSSD